MRKSDRKAIVREWQEKKRRAGIWAMRCADLVWVGATPDLDAARRKATFSLRQNDVPHPVMRPALKAHGAEAFRFEEADVLGEVKPESLQRILKERRAAAAERLGAREL